MNVQDVSFQTLHVIPFICGPIANNTYAVCDDESKDCVIIDPSFAFDRVLKHLEEQGWQPREYWLTHGHYDHFAGTGYESSRALGVDAHLHPLDEPLFYEGIETLKKAFPVIKNSPKPKLDLADGMKRCVGKYSFEVLFTPGHAPGHCCFYCQEASWLFSGDLVFYHSYGRTDLTGGDYKTLITSIQERVLSLPDDTLILPGHEEYTSVREEKRFY